MLYTCKTPHGAPPSALRMLHECAFAGVELVLLTALLLGFLLTWCFCVTVVLSMVFDAR